MHKAVAITLFIIMSAGLSGLILLAPFSPFYMYEKATYISVDYTGYTVYSSPVSNVGYTAKCIAYETTYNKYTVQKNEIRTQYKQVNNNMSEFLKTIMNRLNITLTIRFTVINSTGAIIYNKTITQNDLADRKIEIYSSEQSLKVGDTFNVTLFIDFKMHYEFNSLTLDFAKTFTKTRIITIEASEEEATETDLT